MSNKKEGFTLAEVLLSLTILVTSVYTLSRIQIRSSFKVAKNREEIHRVFLIKKELYKLFLNPKVKEKPFVTKLETPLTKITSHKQEIHKKSELNQFTKEIDIIWAEGEWKYNDNNYSLKMISFAPKPIKKEK
jgi:hypothetical protein